MKQTETAPAGRKPRRFLRRLFRTLLLLLLALALSMTLIPMTETVSEDAKTAEGSADWMRLLPGSLKLDEIVIPGTHDSATQYVRLAFFSKCQALSIREQLEAGFRYLDIRLELAEDGFRLKHGFADCLTGPLPWSDPLKLDAVLDQCYAFLEAHPTETVLFAVKQEHGSASVATFETALLALIEWNPERWLLTDTVPTLEEARGKLVLLRRYEDEAALGEISGIPLIWADQGGHDDVSLGLERNGNSGLGLWVQDRYCYGKEDKWTAFSRGLADTGIPAGEMNIHFLSTKGTLPYGHPFFFAKDLNERLFRLPQEQLRGWIVADFGSAPLAAHIYQANPERFQIKKEVVP